MNSSLAMKNAKKHGASVPCIVVTALLVTWCSSAVADEPAPPTDQAQRRGGIGEVVAAPPPEDTEAEDAKVLAKRSYEDGVRFYGIGELEKSLAAFERAYRLAPHYAVLFNIGQLRSELRQPIEAARALALFLKEGAGRIDRARRHEAERVLALNERFIGRVRIEVQPNDAVVLVDGVPWTLDSSERQLAQGHHVIVANRDGFLPKTEALMIRGGSLSSLRLALEPNPTSEPKPNTSAPGGWLSTICSASNAAIQIDDWAPLRVAAQNGFIRVPAGTRQLRFERVGYATTTFTAQVEPGQTVTVNCGLEPLSVVPLEHRATITVAAANTMGARVLVDDRTFAGGDIVTGPHRVKLVRGTQVVWQKEVDLAPGQVLAIPAQEVPGVTSKQDASFEEQERRRKRFAYATTGAGVAFLAGSVTALVVGAHRYDEWKSERDSLAKANAAPSAWSHAAERAAAVQRIEDLGIGLGVAALALLGTSVYLWTTGKAVEPKQSIVANVQSQSLLLSW